MPEQQLVEIAKALGAEARVADHGRTDGVADRARDGAASSTSSPACARHGAGIIYISHRLDEIFDDRRPDHGAERRQTVATMPRADGRRARDLIRLMVGRELSSVFPEARGARSATSCSNCAGWRTGRPGCANVSLQVRAGEILGLAGPRRIGTHRAGRGGVRPAPGGRRGDAAPRHGRYRSARRRRRDPRRHRVRARGSPSARRGAGDVGRVQCDAGEPGRACRAPA